MKNSNLCLLSLVAVVFAVSGNAVEASDLWTKAVHDVAVSRVTVHSSAMHVVKTVSGRVVGLDVIPVDGSVTQQVVVVSENVARGENAEEAIIFAPFGNVAEASEFRSQSVQDVAVSPVAVRSSAMQVVKTVCDHVVGLDVVVVDGSITQRVAVVSENVTGVVAV
jgi:hypothetical protein